MKMLLTISLLASDRAASLERCLDSLKPLLLQLPSELIIVYTGKNKQVLEIAKRYTDQIIPFEWCNDFSAARNVGLKTASSCILMMTSGLKMSRKSSISFCMDNIVTLALPVIFRGIIRIGLERAARIIMRSA